MANINDSLNRCPFCGEEGMVMSGRRYRVKCEGCYFATPERDTSEEATATWNSLEIKRSEIRVISDEDAQKIMVSAYCKDQFDNQHDNIGCNRESMTAAFNAIKPYLATTRESSGEDKQTFLSIIEACVRNATEAEWMAGRTALAKNICLALLHCFKITKIEGQS